MPCATSSIEDSSAVPLRTHKLMKGISQIGEQGYSLSLQDLPLSPQVRLVLEVLEGPSIEKAEKNNKPLNGNVFLFVTFMQRAGKEIGLSVYFDSRKPTPKRFAHTHTHTWHMEAIEPGTSCVLSPVRASAPCNACIHLHPA